MFPKKLLTQMVPILFSLFLSGCVYVVVGTVGVLGGYVVSPDTVEGIADADVGNVWDATHEIISVMGVIEEESESVGIVKAKITGTKVTVTLTSLTNSTTKISVKARKAFLPKVSLAQDVFVKIMSNLNGG